MAHRTTKNESVWVRANQQVLDLVVGEIHRQTRFLPPSYLAFTLAVVPRWHLDIHCIVNLHTTEDTLPTVTRGWKD